MNRLHLTFNCGSTACAGTLDTAPGTTGLLLVSGGNEIRSGAFGGQALLATHIARSGFPVFRFDRRGVGDSDGENRGFLSAGPDIVAALDAFRALAPQMDRVVAMGNCDAASALMLAGGAGADALVLSNPWTIESDATTGEADDTLPPSAVRSRYLKKLASPREVGRLLRGGVNLRKLAGGLKQAAKRKSAPTSLAQDMAAGIASFEGPVRILLAGEDRTAQAFVDSWPADDTRIVTCDGATHAFVEPDARDWLRCQVVAALRSAK
ncbi:hypothetical protein HME9302_01287 [Alteripontixanthobacter maritimus]|uniref:AB hydrolase-1 domain-containing protein n=1 Tax=Alteripontixanthobacter maritimus TaxID=2161824 RepID=A0A369QCS8_9SPHN|nr:hydrolase 1, exosortase A system-associated [Alteripontixanthobacter maritimus]RDC60088.1 hypothetical protein HME9302_01287 [Alteripontixanthobacter maritimus]